MADDDIQVPADLPVTGTSAPETSEPLAQPDKAAPSTGTEQTAEDTAPAEEAKAETPEAEPPTEEQPQEPKRSPWFVERIGKQREQITERDKRIQDLEGRLAAFERSQQADPSPQPNQPSQQDLVRWADQRADQLAEQKLQVRLFNDTCNKVADRGMAEYKDFLQSRDVLNSLGKLTPEVLNPLFETCEDIEVSPHKVLYNLGKSPEDAERILSLPPHRMGAALARFAEKTSEPKPAPPVSTAPKPVKPISGAAKVSDPSNMSESEWYRNWLKQQGAQP